MCLFKKSGLHENGQIKGIHGSKYDYSARWDREKKAKIIV